MAKQLNVNLAFTADTSKAKSQLQELQNQLSKLTSAPAQNLDLKWTQEIQEATTAAMELKTHLQNATNVQTGTLDFTKLNSSIKSSGKSLSEYARQLQSLGPSGQQAFMQLAGAIAQSEIPIRRSNAALKEMMTTLKNTARWQLSSSMLHGFMGAVQSAYGYAQDLNASLNDIRIVTGQTTDQMAKFAEQANKAAKALSTNTTDYTNASLIYYQQGLTDDEVAKRTAVTVKMANAAGQSAQVVSDQLTSVWNNFYDGSKSLEYYADVMTALGAATASSTDEIAGGLEKFAAVADTIGLSYEYAASALATITSNTRQSEEVVGTALRTIFARIQGLNLGETLEDGTTLNKYSEALQKVGISIFESNGEIKKMDNILDEMASKWQTLAKDQQIALAQTVAGVRQYNQLVSLMDNWNAGDADSMTANLKTAYGASGELQKQADIYAESWEAAQDRVRAASEGIFQSLIDEDFFIGILNGLEKVLTYIDNTIDSLGGLKGVLTSVGVLMTKVFSDQMAQGLRNMAHNIYMSTEGGRQAAKQAKYDALDNMQRQMSLGYDGTGSISGEAAAKQYSQQIAMQKELIANSEKMSQSEIANAQQLLDLRKQIADQVIRAAEREEQAKDRLADSKQKAYMEMGEFKGDAGVTKNDIIKFDTIAASMRKISMESHALEGAFSRFGASIQQNGNASEKEMAELSLAVRMVGKELDMSDDEITQYMNAFKTGGEEAKKAYEQLMGLINAKQGRNQASMQALGVDKKTTQEIVDNYGQIRDAISKKAEAEQRAKLAQEEYKKSLQSAKGVVKDWANSIVSGAQAVMSFASIVNMASGIVDTLTNPDMTGWEKFFAVLQSGAMILTMTVSMFNSLAMAHKNWQAGTLKNAAVTLIDAASESLLAKAKRKTEGASKAKDKALEEENAELGKNIALNTADGMSEGNVGGKKTGGELKSLKTSFGNFGKAAKEWISANSSMLTSVGIAAVGVAIIIGTVATVINQMNKAEKAVEKAKAAAQSLSENYDNVKASYDNFINAQSGYETAAASMEELTKGTVAYQEALIQANEAAGELLATNKNLKYTIEDGKIVIDEDSLEQARIDEVKKVEAAQAAKIAGQRELSEAEMELKKRDAARAMKSGSDGWQKTGNAAAGGVLGAIGAGVAAGGIAGAIGGGGVFSVPAAIVGAIIGGVAGLVTGIVQETSTQTEQKAFDALAEKAETDEDFLARLRAGEVSEEEFKSIGIEDKGLIASLQQNGEQVAELVGEMAANTAAINAQNDLVASNVLSDNEAVQNSEYRDQIVDIAGDAYGHAYDKAMESDWVNTWGKQGIAQINGANDEAKKVFDEYLKYAGLEDAGYTLTDTWGNDDNREFVYKDSAGEEHVVSLEAMQAARAAYEASNTLDQSATKLAVTFDKLAGSSNEADQALLSFVSGKNFEGATKGELEDIQKEVGSIEKNTDGTFTQDSLNNVRSYLEDALGETLTDDVAIRYGHESAEAMINAFATKLSDADEAWDSIKVPDNFKFADDMSLGAALSLEKQINKINLGPLGKQAGEEYVTQLNSMLSQVDVEDQQKALDALTAVDWSDWDALEQVDAIMKEFGVDINTSSEEWQKFAEEMRIAAGATPDFSQLRDTLISITSILQDLDFGSVISEEDYQKLVQYNDEWERFFMLQANGTRVFIGDSDDMQQTLQKDLLQKQQDLQDRKKAQEGFEEANWGHYDETGEKWVSANWNNMSGSDTGTAANLIKSSGATEDMLEQLGYTDDIIQGFIDQATSGQEDLVAEGQASLREMYKRIGEFAKEDLDALDEEYKEMIASTATNIDELKDLLNDELIDEKQYSKQLKVLASQATKFKELSNLKEAGLDAETYGDSLVKLGSQYTDCVDEVNAYNKALESGSTEDAEKALEDLEEALKKAEFRKFAKDTLDFLESLKDDTGWANNIENINKLREAYQYLLDTDFSGFSEEFLKSAENINLMTEALKGSDEAWDQLKLNAASEIFNFAGISGSLRTELDAVTAMIAGYDFGDIEIGTELNDTPFWDALSQMEIGSAEAAQAISDGLSSMGVDAELEKHEVTIPPGKSYETRNGYHEYVDNEGVLHQIPINSQVTETDQGQTYTWYTIKGAKYNGKGVTPPEPPKEDRNPSGGGGGSQPKKATPTKKSDVVQRYKEVEDKLDDIRDEADRTRSSLDRLYGKEQEAAIERLLELERQEIELMKEKERAAQKYLQEDLKELQKVSAEVNVDFKFDEKGNIKNYEEEMTELYEELAEIERKAGDEWDENEQKEIDALNEKIKKLEEAIAAYEETRELLEDIGYQLDEMAGTPPLPLIKSDYLDIYFEVEDKLDDIEEKISDLEREAENLTGEERLAVLRQIQELEEERLKTLEEQKEIARQDMEDKKAAMEEIAERNDLNFEYDGNGNITNYISEMEKLNKAYEELYDEVTEDGLVTDTELAALDAMREDMEQMEEYALGYRQAMESIEDIQNEIEDKGSGKANDRFVRSDYIDIYRETEDQLDDIDEKISDLERQADRLTGEERIAKLKEIQKLEKERLEILKKQKEIAKQDLEDRKAALEEIATANGLLFEFDENGNVTNYEEQLDKMLVKYEEEYTRAMADGVITATEQAILDAIDQDIEELKDAIDAYRDVVEQMEDIQNEMEDISEGGYVDMEQLDEIGDKLHDINQELDDIEEALNDSSEAADRLYGAARIKQMDKTTQMLEKEIDALERKKELQKDIIAEERAEVDTATGGKAQYDSNGNITNYHDLIDSRKDAIRAREAELKADGDFTEAEAAEIQEMIDELERMEEEIDEYEQALEDQEDIENAIDDAFYEWQDLNAEKLSYKLELTLSVNDRELAKIERQISRLEGNFYSRAEALALMVGGGMGGSSKLGQLNSQLGELEAHYAEVKRAYEAGEISHAAYVEQTQQLQAEIENTAAEMEALQEQMDSYYKDTLAAARQELNFHISQIEHLTGVLGHYKNILTALGKSQDYEMMGTVLEGQVEALENEVQVAKRAMGMWQQEADEAYAKYQQALASGNQENADMYYQAYQEAINAANEAENKYYSKAQQWAQALKALMENTLAGLAQDLENALTGGTSFETINTQLKRASSLQEEYLTTTNKIYETTKLMRTAQNEIDKTTNSVAKKKLANFITETKQMQNQNKLSKYELSIQQAKYDLLLAEIALEEARLAKSTVRLRRDSEGNFGYVYTADAEAVANAEQKFEDAQNKLYNIGLDGANKYTEKYQQTLSEMYNTLTQLQTKYLQGGFESEAEYNAAVSEAKAYYYEKLGQYSDLYSVALTTDSRVVADAWSTDFADMTQQTETWMNAVTDYLGQVRAAFAEWEQESDRIANETVGTNLETVKQKVAGIVSESDAMVTSINNSVIPAIQAEINEVQALTDQYAAMNGQMSMAIDNAYALSDAMQSDIDASVEKEMANMEAAEQEETQTQLDILTQQYNETLKTALEDNDISDEEQAQLDAIEREITALQNADSIIAEFEEAYKAAIADEVISDEEQEALNAIAQKLVDLKDEMAALEITNETLDALIAKIAEVESMEAFIEKYRTAYKAAVEDDNTISPAEQEGLNAIKEEIAKLRGFDEEATQQTNETLSTISEQLAAAQQEEAAQAQTLQGMLEELTTTYIGELILKVSDIYNSIVNASGMINEVSAEPASYDTGGYTGQWGPSGKWALLHEKELILNQGDTSNLLASLDLLDSILSTIDLHAMNSQFNSMINSPYIQDLGKETLEQMVTIEANFPNATDKLEIEEAFKDLVNLASQYANRK